MTDGELWLIVSRYEQKHDLSLILVIAIVLVDINLYHSFFRDKKLYLPLSQEWSDTEKAYNNVLTSQGTV